MKAEDGPELYFPYGFGEYAADCAADGGVFYHAVVRLPGGARVQVGFYDPVRLTQDLEQTGCCVALPGMIVVPSVTLECMRIAVNHLFLEGYFESLAPLPDGADSRPSRGVRRNSGGDTGQQR
jgi:hypothetical protein